MSIITAITTPFGEGGVSIIRVSGEGVFDSLNENIDLINLMDKEKNTISFAHFLDEKREKIDEILVSKFVKPNSYTGEDTVEINCHGGIFITNKILKVLLKKDEIRLAEKGEFTKKAFLNGKKSFSEVQGVYDIITANNETAHKLAINSLLGNTEKMIENMRLDLMDIVSLIEVNIDYPEYVDIEQPTYLKLEEACAKYIEKIEAIIVESKKGELLKSGINTLIVGVPNVGKSSILNLLSKEEKAIVTDEQGTTRDMIQVKVNLGNVDLNLIDTAGIRKTENKVEKIGIKKTIDAIDKAELIIFVTENDKVLTVDEIEILEKIKQKKYITLINKVDLSGKFTTKNLNNEIAISAIKGFENSLLETAIVKIFGIDNLELNNFDVLSSVNQIAKLEKVKILMERVKVSTSEKTPIDLIEIDLKEALFLMGQILGIDVNSNLLDELFSKFCLGK